MRPVSSSSPIATVSMRYTSGVSCGRRRRALSNDDLLLEAPPLLLALQLALGTATLLFPAHLLYLLEPLREVLDLRHAEANHLLQARHRNLQLPSRAVLDD